MTHAEQIRKFLEEQNELREKATPGPWHVSGTGQSVLTEGESPIDNRRICESDSSQHYYHGKTACWNNISFIAESRISHEQLCKMVEIMSEAVEPYGGPLKEALQKCAEIVSGEETK